MQQVEITTLMSIDPSVAQRVQRLQYAIDLLKADKKVKEARKRIQAIYGCSYATAWRTVSIASDIVL